MWPDDPALANVLVAGLGITNTAASRALVGRGSAVVLVDDGDPIQGESLSAELGVAFHHRPPPEDLEGLLSGVDAVLPAPGLPEAHPLFEATLRSGVPVISEFDLARRWDDRPVIAVTGTDGKTTVCTMVAAMLEASSVPTDAVGNLEVPLVAAIEDPRPECFVVEASSFRLGHSLHFAPRVGTWLNFGPDHLDVHRDITAYRRAKSRIWAEQGPGDTAVANLDDAAVAAGLPRREGVRVWSYGITDSARDAGAEFHQDGPSLVGPGGEVLVERGELWRDLPHDRSNALGASATALAAGATLAGVRSALKAFRGLPHRVELVAEAAGVRWYDDSKATAPHATLAALAGFERVVLVAGGRNKGLDLAELGSARNVVAVVGIGEAALAVVDVFPSVPSRHAESMAEAVTDAAALVQDALQAGGPPVAVLLSPGCASFDWYSSYAERGEDFAFEVRRLLGRDAVGGAS